MMQHPSYCRPRSAADVPSTSQRPRLNRPITSMFPIAIPSQLGLRCLFFCFQGCMWLLPRYPSSQDTGVLLYDKFCCAVRAS